MFVTMGIFANAQTPKVLAEIAASSERMVKNAPFSAEAISESVQTLADGNRIVRSSTSKLYRNSEGRFRREMTSGSGGGVLGSLYSYGNGVTLLDPVGGFRYMIDPELRTTRQVMMKPRSDIRIVTGPGSPPEGAVSVTKINGEVKIMNGEHAIVMSDKVREELKAVAAVAPVAAARATAAVIATEPLTGVGFAYSTGSNSKWDTRTEQLGVQNIEGIDAEGTRTVTTIPAGAIGNERPIEITYEKWYSNELQLVVMSKHNDPRFGEQTYRLTNIVRSEPDASLFTLPNGYRMITEPSGTYTLSPARALTEKAAAGQAARSAAPSAKTKP